MGSPPPLNTKGQFKQHTRGTSHPARTRRKPAILPRRCPASDLKSPPLPRARASSHGGRAQAAAPRRAGGPPRRPSPTRVPPRSRHLSTPARPYAFPGEGEEGPPGTLHAGRSHFHPGGLPRSRRETSPSTKRGEEGRAPGAPPPPKTPPGALASQPALTGAGRRRTARSRRPRAGQAIPPEAGEAAAAPHSPVPSGAALPDDRRLPRAPPRGGGEGGQRAPRPTGGARRPAPAAGGAERGRAEKRAERSGAARPPPPHAALIATRQLRAANRRAAAT